MIDGEAAARALNLLMSDPVAWLVVPPGILAGLVFGAIPGLSTSIAMAILLPITLYMDFLPAILFLTAIFTGGGFGASIPAILMNIPGTSAAVATTFDGYPMARRGEHNQAMGLALAASTVGAFVGYLVLLIFIGPIAGLVLRLGPSEMLVVAIWGLSLIAILQDRHFGRGLFAGFLGLTLGLIGYSQLGIIRGTAGSAYLLDGVPAIPALIGMFAASEIFNLIRTDYLVADPEKRRLSFWGVVGGIRQALRFPGLLVRGGLIGTIIGAVPGVGSSVSNLIAYADAKRRLGHNGTFGQGDPRGVVAPEAANSSSEGGSMATLLALGIPGGAGTAVMLAAFSMHNITGGPRFLNQNTDLVYAIIFGNFIQVILLMIIGLGFIFVASSIVKVPLRYLIPSVMVLAFMGAYAHTGNVAGPITVAVFAVIGWIMRRYHYPVAATVIGLLLANMIEGELLRTYQLASGRIVTHLADRPVTILLLAIFFLSLLVPLVRSIRRGRQEPTPNPNGDA
jgi:putative tricarboxylic transport membrane protein